MNNVYRRYFEIKDAATLARINELVQSRVARAEQIANLRDELGAENAVWYESGRVAGFEFDGSPDLKAWKEVDHGYMPRLNTKAGKAIQAKIDGLGTPSGEVSSALEVVGLHTSFPVLIGGGKGYRAGLCGSPTKGWYAVVPWYDEDPAELEKYKADRDAGRRGCGNFDHLLWTPPAEWVPVKEWQVQKAMDDDNAANAADGG